MHFAKPRWMPRANSLATRLLLSHFAVLLVVGAFGVFAPMALQRWSPTVMTRRVLIEESQNLLEGLRSGADGRPTHIELSDESAWLYSVLPAEFLYRVVDAQGQVVISSQPGGAALVPVAGQAFDPELGVFEVPDGRGGDSSATLSVRATPFQHGGQRWTLQVAASRRLVKLTRLGIGSTYVRAALAPLALLLLVVSVVIVWTLHRMLKPLREASLAAGHIAPNALHVRLAQRGVPSEVLPLIEAFNQALARLERGFALQQEFLATAAHELKTPLALIRAQLEADGCASDSPLLADVDFMSRQVQQLLHLAEVSEVQNFSFETVDLQAVATEVAAYLGRLADRAGVRLQVHAHPGAGPCQRPQADRSALFILLKNLVENAIQHSPAGGLVRLDVVATGLRVTDQGPGVAAADLPQLFNRFWRGSTRQHSGAGLGLTICQVIAQAHGWRLQASSGGPEPGTVFTLHTAPGDPPGEAPDVTPMDTPTDAPAPHAQSNKSLSQDLRR